jgi:uncharacterized protein
MKKAVFVFHDELNDFLSLSRRGAPVNCQFQGAQSAKHLVEALRVPHTEVGEVLVNARVNALNYIVQDGDRLDIYPDKPLPPPPDQKPRFLLDNHLGKLASFLRILGFDVLYRNDFQDEELALLAVEEDRILLTRDRGLLMRRLITRGHCLHSLDPHEQLAEIVEHYELLQAIRPFTRCPRCNALLETVEKAQVVDRLEPLTRLYFDEFAACTACSQIYWKGSHYQHIQEFLRSNHYES